MARNIWSVVRFVEDFSNSQNQLVQIMTSD